MALLQPADGTVMMLDQFCMLFKSSFFVSNGTTTCHNARPFMCYRLWTNPGLSGSPPQGIDTPSSTNKQSSITTRTDIPAPSSCLPNMATRLSSSPGTHPVKLNPGLSTGFWLQVVSASVGDRILFSTCTWPFLLYTTTLEDPCGIISRIIDMPVTWHLVRVVNRELIWLLVCQAAGPCVCSPDSHFALNPGNLSGEFSNQVSAL
ncbi:hypothetical protein BJY01DRAFT_139697 [Aspergillus pseudoustus]|uniref:Uncharacterized protein n=1 Tax=Aspergillus pseudoustus TaxID=1810923 RepID=A0ABR4IHR1_9EURO